MFQEQKLILWLTFNLGLALTGFATTRLSSIKKNLRQVSAIHQSEFKVSTRRIASVGKQTRGRKAEVARKPLTGNKREKN